MAECMLEFILFNIDVYLLFNNTPNKLICENGKQQLNILNEQTLFARSQRKDDVTLNYEWF